VLQMSPEDRRRGEMRARQDEHTPSSLNGVSSEIDRRRVVSILCGIGDSLMELRASPDFWTGLGPAFRVRYEDFQADLATLRSAWRK
jgi:hypothetical protein